MSKRALQGFVLLTLGYWTVFAVITLSPLDHELILLSTLALTVVTGVMRLFVTSQRGGFDRLAKLSAGFFWLELLAVYAYFRLGYTVWTRFADVPPVVFFVPTSVVLGRVLDFHIAKALWPREPDASGSVE
ncbi:MAG: hypothetical protein K8R88_09440 [Armatimonadetes bacterium]|nr:hypothetical protein [Armatimonadota bacterium]